MRLHFKHLRVLGTLFIGHIFDFSFRLLIEAESKLLTVNAVTLEHLDIEQVHLLDDGVEVDLGEEVLDSEHGGEDLVHERVDKVHSCILHNDDALIDLVDNRFERFLLLLLVDDLGLIGLHQLLHHEMVDEK